MFLNIAAALCLFSLFLIGAVAGRTSPATCNDGNHANGDGMPVNLKYD